MDFEIKYSRLKVSKKKVSIQVSLNSPSGGGNRIKKMSNYGISHRKLRNRKRTFKLKL